MFWFKYCVRKVEIQSVLNGEIILYYNSDPVILVRDYKNHCRLVWYPASQILYF